jgi:thiol peroxidase
MTITHFKGADVKVNGELPKVGTQAPDFSLVKTDLSNLQLSDLRGKKVILNIFPSIDTSVCATSVRKFNQKASTMENTVVLCISKDLPFAQARFCGAEGLNNVITLSDFRKTDFTDSYGLLMMDGPLAGLLARCIIVINEEGKIIYTQLVDEITNEPDYENV